MSHLVFPGLLSCIVNMVNIRLNSVKKLRLKAVLKSKWVRLQQLRARQRCCVTVSNAFTSESLQFEVVCIEELRACIENSMRFVKARIFHNNRELTDYDDIETQLTFVKEADPKKALVYLDGMDSKITSWDDELPWRTNEVMVVKTTILALRMMDLLPHHVYELILLGSSWTHLRNIPNELLSDLGTTIGQACAGLMMMPKSMVRAIQELTLGIHDVPRWMLAALMEIAVQRPAMLRPYVLDIIKGTVLFLNNSPWYRRDWANHAQIEFDKLMGCLQGIEHFGVMEYITILKACLTEACLTDGSGWLCKLCSKCKSRLAILDVLCRMGLVGLPSECGNVLLLCKHCKICRVSNW